MSTIRFFLVASPAPVGLLAGFGVVVAFGGWTVVLNPRDLDPAFASILLLQLLACSTGLLRAASRGHLDPLLVSGRTRASIAAGSLVAASLPGAVAWLSMVAIALSVGEAAGARALTPHRLAAFVIVSSGAWSLGLVLPRLAGGALWMMVMIALAVNHAAFGRFVTILEPPAGVAQVLLTAAACAACPLLFLSDRPGPTDPRVILLAVAAAAALAATAVWHVSTRDYPLQEVS